MQEDHLGNKKNSNNNNNLKSAASYLVKNYLYFSVAVLANINALRSFIKY